GQSDSAHQIGEDGRRTDKAYQFVPTRCRHKKGAAHNSRNDQWQPGNAVFVVLGKYFWNRAVNGQPVAGSRAGPQIDPTGGQGRNSGIDQQKYAKSRHDSDIGRFQSVEEGPSAQPPLVKSAQLPPSSPIEL